MNHSRLRLRTAPPDGLAEVASAYGLGEVQSWSLVGAGRSRVYRLVCDRGPGPTPYAVKLVASPSAEDWQLRELENRLLMVLRPRFDHLPVLVRPAPLCGSEPAPVWRPADTAVAVYHWLDHQAFDQSQRQRNFAAARLVQLYRILEEPKLPVADLLPRSEPLYALGDGPPRFAQRFSFVAFRGVTLPEARLLPLDVGWPEALDFLEDELRTVKADLAERQSRFAGLPRGLVHSEGSPGNCGFDSNGDLKVVFDLDSVRPGTAIEGIAFTLAAFSIDRNATVRRVRGRMAAMLAAMEGVASFRDEERQALPAVIRLRYLEFAWQAVARLADGKDRRPGFLQDDILALRWLRRHPEAVDLGRSG